jgi:hypothetical protein
MFFHRLLNKLSLKRGLAAAMIGAADGLATVSTLLGAFVLGQVVVEPGERVKAPAAVRAV